MKKKYVSPMMAVEDFTMSEMVAKNCQLVPSELTIVQQANLHEPCATGAEMSPEDGTAYSLFSDLYEGGHDFDGNGHTMEYCFTDGYNQHSNKNPNVCSYDPVKNGINFGHNSGYDCSNDSTLIQNS